MASTYDPLLNLELQGTGENSGTWGGRLNDSVIKLMAEASHGVAAVAVSGAVSLTSSNGASDQARKKVLKFTGTGGTVTAPAREHEYFIINACSGAVTFKSSATAGVSIPAGASVFVVWTGSAFEMFDAEATARAWAVTTGALVDGSDYSSKEWAIGTTVPAGSSKDWAQQTGSMVDGSEWGAKEYALGADVPAGSAKGWAQKSGSTVDGSGYSAKEHAQGSPDTGSAKGWATTTGGTVADGEYSAKAYAQSTNAVTGGSAKDWAIKTGGAVSGGEYSAKHHAGAASTSAGAAAASAGDASTSAGTALGYASAAGAAKSDAEAARDLAQTYAAALTGTSTSSVAIGTGSKSFTTQAGKQWQVGQTLRLAYDASNYMTGIVTAYSGTSLTVNVQSIVGSGTRASWTIGISGDKGDQGIQGIQGDQGVPGNSSFTQISSTTVSTAVAAVDFTSISSSYNELAVAIETAKHNNGSSQTLRLQYSIDNGSSWSTAVDISLSSDNATNRDGSIHLCNFNAGRFEVLAAVGNSASLPIAAAGSTNIRVVARTTAKPNALRFTWSAGNHASGSVFTLSGR